MAVDVSRIPNNNKFDPVREAILQLQSDVQSGVSGVGSINGQDGLITITGGDNIGISTAGTTITVGLDSSIDLTNITLSGYLRGPASFVIDPAAHGDETGTVVIRGNLQVDGDTTTINSTTLTVDDKNIVIASGAANAAAADGAGITIDGASATMTYNSTSDRFVFNKDIEADLVGNVTGNVTGNLTGDVTGDVTGNVTGDLTGNVTGDVTGDLTGNADTATNADQVDGKHAEQFTLDYVTGNPSGNTTDNKITLGGGLHVNTLTNTKPLEISRLGGTTTQLVKIGVTDTTTDFKYIEDTTNEGNGSFGSYRFILGGNDGETDIVALQIYKDNLDIAGSIDVGGDIDVGGSTVISSTRSLDVISATVKGSLNLTTPGAELQVGGVEVIDASRNITAASLATDSITGGTINIDASTRLNLQYAGSTKAYVDSSGFTIVDAELDLTSVAGISLTDSSASTDSYFHANVNYDAGLYTVTSNTRYGSDYIQVDGLDSRDNVRFAISPKDIGSPDPHAYLYIGGDNSITAPNTLVDWHTIEMNALSVQINGNEVATQTWVTNTALGAFDLQDVTDNGAITTNIIEVGGLTSNSSAKFYSNSSARVLYLIQNVTNGGNIIQFQDQTETNVWEVVGRNNGFYIYNNNAIGTAFTINPTNNRVWINSGVGFLNDPGYMLRVSGDAYMETARVKFIGGQSYNENIRMYAGTNDYSSLVLGAVSGDSGTGVGQWTLVRYPSTAGLDNKFSIRHNTSDHIVVLTGGNVGIGVGSPTARLNVQGVGTANDPVIAIDNTSSSAFVHSLEAFAGSLTAGQVNLLMVGKQGNTKNSGYIGYNWSADASNDNYVTVGHWGVDNVFRIYGDQRAYFAGYVGIGNSSPLYHLDVAGNIRLTGTYLRFGTDSDNYIAYSGNTAYLRADGTHYFEGQGFYKGVWTSDGKMGIGVDSPNSKLEVRVASGDNNQVRISASENVYKDLQWYDTTSGEMWIWSHRIGADGNKLQAWYNNGTTWNTQPAITLATNNYVGINTDSPSYNLDVGGTARIQSNAQIDGDLIVLGSGDGVYVNSSGHASLRVDRGSTTYDNNLLFFTAGVLDFRIWQDGSSDYLYVRDENGGGGNMVTFQKGGNVGIGTGTPSYKLDVSGHIRINNGASNHLYFGTDSANYLAYSSNSAYWRANIHYFEAPVGFKGIWDSSGNLGVGTTTPNAKLHTTGKTLSITSSSSWGQSAVANPNDAEAGFVWAAGGSGYPGITSTYTRQWIAGLSPFGTGTDRWSLTNRTLGANTAITVLEDGKVGIGTTGPSFKLDVNGTLRASSYFVTPLIYSGGGNVVFGNVAQFNDWVGIGTTSPQDLLNIHSSSASANIGLKITRGTQTHGLRLGVNNTHAFLWTTEAQDLAFATSNQQRLTIKSGGNIGIGTDSPSYKLQVQKTSTSAPAIMVGGSYSGGPRIQTYGLDADANAWMGLGTDMGGNPYEHSVYFPQVSGYDGVLTFGSYNGTTYSTKMVIRSSGNVGIGATSPSRKLHVAGEIFVEDSQSTGMGVVLRNGDRPLITRGWDPFSSGNKSGIGRWGVFMESASLFIASPGTDYTNGYTELGGFLVDGTKQVTLSCNNYTRRVGILTRTPSYDLDVNGTIRASGDVIAYSDARVKENVKTIDNALDKVTQLRGVSYNKIGETEEKIGVIAQEIEKVLPQVVQEDDNGMKSVAYGNIVGVLIEAIKEQQKQIDELKAIINGGS